MSSRRIVSYILLFIGIVQGFQCEDDQTLSCPQSTIKICEGDTRGDRRCAHDSTHRVCAIIGNPETSFFEFTGQTNWCGTVGHYGGYYGNLPRCPLENPTWCICKWATSRWIAAEGCGDTVEIDCEATDICATSNGLYFSYTDFDQNLHAARTCAEKKCTSIWNTCNVANSPSPDEESMNDFGTSKSTPENGGTFFSGHLLGIV